MESAVGTQIEWSSDDMDPTFKRRVKKVKKGKKVTKQTIKERVPSFFDFFSGESDFSVEDSLCPESPKEILEDEVDFLVNDFFKNQLEYYLNLATDSKDGSEEEESEEDEDDDDDDDDDNDDKPKKKKGKVKGKKTKKEETKQECKNQ